MEKGGWFVRVAILIWGFPLSHSRSSSVKVICAFLSVPFKVDMVEIAEFFSTATAEDKQMKMDSDRKSRIPDAKVVRALFAFVIK
jgi:hypothetical protein